MKRPPLSTGAHKLPREGFSTCRGHYKDAEGRLVLGEVGKTLI